MEECSDAVGKNAGLLAVMCSLTHNVQYNTVKCAVVQFMCSTA